VRDEVTSCEGSGRAAILQRSDGCTVTFCAKETRGLLLRRPAAKSIASAGVSRSQGARAARIYDGLDRDSLPTIEEAKKRAEPWGDSDAAGCAIARTVRKSLAAAERTREKAPKDEGSSDDARRRVLEEEIVEHEQRKGVSRSRRKAGAIGRNVSATRKTESRSARGVTELSLA